MADAPGPTIGFFSALGADGLMLLPFGASRDRLRDVPEGIDRGRPTIYLYQRAGRPFSKLTVLTASCRAYSSLLIAPQGARRRPQTLSSYCWQQNNFTFRRLHE